MYIKNGYRCKSNEFCEITTNTCTKNKNDNEVVQQTVDGKKYVGTKQQIDELRKILA